MIYHIDRVLRETGEVIDNGYQEIYVNAEIDDGSDFVVCNNTKFPIICDLTDYYKNGKGRDTMCQAVEEYAKEYAKECGKINRMEGRMECELKGKMEGKILAYHDMGLSPGEISSKMNLPVDKIQCVLDDSAL